MKTVVRELIDYFFAQRNSVSLLLNNCQKYLNI